MDEAGTLHSKRLRLTPLKEGDEGFVLELLRCKLVRRYLGGVVATDEVRPTFERYLDIAAKQHVWVVRKGATAAHPIGLIFLETHQKYDALELSFQFEAGSWGKGFAQEACATVMRFARQDLGASRLVAETQAANVRSIDLLHRLGFREMERLTRFGELQIVFAARSESQAR